MRCPQIYSEYRKIFHYLSSDYFTSFLLDAITVLTFCNTTVSYGFIILWHKTNNSNLISSSPVPRYRKCKTGEMTKWRHGVIRSSNTANTSISKLDTYLDRLRIATEQLTISLKSIFLLFSLLLLSLACGLTWRQVSTRILYAFLLSTNTAVSSLTQDNSEDFSIVTVRAGK